MYMFESVLETVPKSRSQFVNELDLPEVTVAPYVWTEPAESLTDSDSLPSVSDSRTLSSDSSLALSRAMTDSEIDYERYRRMRSRRFSDPWLQMRAALDAFPPGYLESLNSFQTLSSEVTETSPSPSLVSSDVPRQHYNEELRLKMERFFEDECQAFAPDDPGLVALEEALEDLHLKDPEIPESDSTD